MHKFPLYGIDFLDQTIFDWDGEILAANYGQPRPIFDLDLNFHYNTYQTTINKCMNACMKQQASSQFMYYRMCALTSD